MNQPPDRLVRCVSEEGGIAVRAIVGTELVREGAARHRTSPTATTALGRTLLGALLLAASGKEDDESVQVQFRGDGPLKGVVAGADALGNARGYVGSPRAHPPRVDGQLDVHAAVGAGVLTVVRMRAGQQPYTGIVQIVHGTIAQDLTHYLSESEQSQTALALGVQEDPPRGVRSAAGYLVHALPGASEAEIDRVEENVRATPNPSQLVAEGLDAHGLLARLLEGLGMRDAHELPVAFHCGCNEERVSRALQTLGREELERAIEEAEPIGVECHFCAASYQVGPDRLRVLIEAGEESSAPPS